MGKANRALMIKDSLTSNKDSSPLKKVKDSSPLKKVVDKKEKLDVASDPESWSIAPAPKAAGSQGIAPSRKLKKQKQPPKSAYQGYSGGALSD